MFIKTKDNIHLNYKDWGSGEPIVLIHGWPLSSDMWEHQARKLVHAGFRVISYDRRGFGKSEQPFYGYNYDTLADDLHSIIKKLQLEDVTLVGFSMGGGEVARYLSRHGDDKIKAAVFISSVVPFILKTADNPTGVDFSLFENMKIELDNDRPKFLKQFAKNFYGLDTLHHDVSAESLEWTKSLALQASPEATIRCIDAFAFTDFRPDIQHIKVPTLIIHGTGDKIVPLPTTSAQLKELLPLSEVRYYEKAPHGLFLTHRDQLFEDLRVFIQSDLKMFQERYYDFQESFYKAP